MRNSCGNVYPPNTLYSVCCGIQRYIKEHRPQINIFKDACFSGFAKKLDSEMKRLHSIGVSVNKKTGGTTDKRRMVFGSKVFWEIRHLRHLLTLFCVCVGLTLP